VNPDLREQISSGIRDAVSLGSGFESACSVIGMDPRRLQRWRKKAVDGRVGGLRTSDQKLTETEKDAIVEAFHKPEYVDLPIRSAWVKMVDDKLCLCSAATAYRVLEERCAKRRLTARRASPQRRPPVLEATAVNQVWTWDITYLPSPVRGAYFYLYCVQDLFSRKIVGWSVEATEDGALARDLFDRIVSQKIARPQELRVHADNGSPMRSVVLNKFFNRLEIRCTHSRPHTSDDNAFIESLFSVLKGRASFPEYFKDILQARAYVQALVEWYNTKHMHSRLDYLTPTEVEQGKAEEIQARRNEVIEKARALRPQRFGKRKLYFRVPKAVRLAFHETVSYD
jgi:putative transposase